MYFNADVQRRVLEQLPLRPARRRLPLPRQVRGDGHPHQPLLRRGRDAPRLRQGKRQRRPRPHATAAGRRSTVAPTTSRGDHLLETARSSRPTAPAADRPEGPSPGPTATPGSSSAIHASSRPAVQGPGDVVPADRAAVPPRAGARRAAGRVDHRHRVRARRPAAPQVLEARLSPVGTDPVPGVSVEPSSRSASSSCCGRSCERSRARPRDGLRRAAVDRRGARDHQRGAAVDERRARDHQRGAALDERRARDDERGAPVDQRGARDDQRRAASTQGAELDKVNALPRRILSSFRSASPCCSHHGGAGLERPGRGAVGAAGRRGRSASTSSTSTSVCPSPTSARTYGACWPPPTVRRSALVAAVNRRGRRIECNVTMSALVSEQGETVGVIVLMDRVDRAHVDDGGDEP